MQNISISDRTLTAMGTAGGPVLSFREKLELAKLLDKMNISVIELPALNGTRADSLLVKSISSAVRNASVALQVGFQDDGPETAWAAVKGAARPRLQLAIPASPMQMEYFWHKKPDKMLAAIREKAAACLALCPEVELIADDACRAEKTFLYDALREAAEAGVSQVTVCDSAGTLFPEEMEAFLKDLFLHVPELNRIRLGVLCSDAMSMGGACTFAAIRAGASEIKVVSCSGTITRISDIAAVFRTRGDELGLACSLRQTELKRLQTQIDRMCSGTKAAQNPFENGAGAAETMLLSVHDDKEAVAKAAESIGYTLSEEDIAKVYEAFSGIAGRKESISARELDSIIAAVAMQVPPTYTLQNYVISCVSGISSSAHLRLEKKNEVLEGICTGDGPIDASFLCIEKIIGRHYELDDFQIQAVTEGHEAMGETVVRLRWDGKLYSGRGISTDIICAGIHAYLNAVNKIAYEEAEA